MASSACFVPAAPLLSTSFVRPCVQRAHAPRRVDASRRAPVARLVPLPTGTNMEVLDDPTPSQAPSVRSTLIFVHGSLHAAWTYKLFQPFFAARGYQTHSISLRGAGATTQPQTESTTVAQHVADLTALIDVVSPAEPVVLVGHSLGGFTVQKLLQTTDDPARRVAALVLLGSTSPLGNDAVVWRNIRDGRFRNFWRLTRGFVFRAVARELDLCRHMFFLPPDAPGFDPQLEGDDVLRDYMARFEANALSVDMRSLKPYCAPRDDGFVPPVLSVGGGKDVINDRACMEEVAGLWGGDTHWVEDAPHDMMLYSGWRNVAEAIADWLDTRIPASKS